jgi:hypothetical protein
MHAYCAGKHWILYWIQENKTATYFLRSRLFTYDIMKTSNRCYTDLLHFSTRKHNLVSSSAESYFDSRITSYFLIYSFFFQEKTLGDISFKLETKLMNFMSVIFLRKYNQVNSSVVNNMKYNLFTIFPLTQILLNPPVSFSRRIRQYFY